MPRRFGRHEDRSQRGDVLDVSPGHSGCRWFTEDLFSQHDMSSSAFLAWPRSLQQAPDPGQRYCDPVRAVVEFVTELVAGLLELEGRAGPPRRLEGSRQEV